MLMIGDLKYPLCLIDIISHHTYFILPIDHFLHKFSAYRKAVRIVKLLLYLATAVLCFYELFLELFESKIFLL
jgi:hypothetical protein